MELVFQNQNILIVDDDFVQHKIFEQFLTKYSKNIFFAKDGLDALEKFKSIKIDLIITDLKMPNMDGDELIKIIRQNNYWIPIVVATSNLTANYFLSCANLNIQGLIKKPIRQKLVEEILEKVHFYNEKTSTLKQTNKNITNLKLEDNIYYDSNSAIIINNNEELTLNKKEKLLLELLIDNKNRVVSYKNIETVIWYYDDRVMTQDALKNVIKSLRKKTSKEFIKNVSGLGYKIIL